MKKNVISENYLERIPSRRKDIRWNVDNDGIVTLEIENKGIINKIFQVLFKKPKISYIHLDKMGSFLWKKLEGEKSIIDLGEDVEKEFGEFSYPLYERLAKYIRILDSYNFIEW